MGGPPLAWARRSAWGERAHRTALEAAAIAHGWPRPGGLAARSVPAEPTGGRGKVAPAGEFLDPCCGVAWERQLAPRRSESLRQRRYGTAGTSGSMAAPDVNGPGGRDRTSTRPWTATAAEGTDGCATRAPVRRLRPSAARSGRGAGGPHSTSPRRARTPPHAPAAPALGRGGPTPDEAPSQPPSGPGSSGHEPALSPAGRAENLRHRQPLQRLVAAVRAFRRPPSPHTQPRSRPARRRIQRDRVAPGLARRGTASTRSERAASLASSSWCES